MSLPEPSGHQRDVVYLQAKGHQVVLGTAGTGKTVMAIHRSKFLAAHTTVGNGPTLLLAFNASLVNYLRRFGPDLPGVTIETYERFARGYLASRGLMGRSDIVDAPRRRHFVEEAIKIVAADSPDDVLMQPTDFFLDELAWIQGSGFATVKEYVKADRVGRMKPLPKDHRRLIWKVRGQYLEAREFAGFRYDWYELPAAVRASFESDRTTRRYRHIVVDEAQDFPPEAIRSLAKAVPKDGSLTLFADYAQQSPGPRTSWRGCGLVVKSTEIFQHNYRNTLEIARLAIGIAEMPHFKDSADLVDPQVPPRAEAAKPTLVRYRSVNEEVAGVVAEVTAARTVPARIGILARTDAQARKLAGKINDTRMLTGGLDGWDARSVARPVLRTEWVS